MIIIDLDQMKAWRIEPNDVPKYDIKIFGDFYVNFFNQLGIKFDGFYPLSCPIDHGGLCRYVTYAQYLWKDRINHAELKYLILNFLKLLIQQTCNA